MRKFLMALALTCTASTATALPVDANSPTGMAAAYVTGVGSGCTVLVLCTDGSIWRLQRAGTSQFPEEFIWQAPELHSPTGVPVPVSEILDWTPMTVTTRSGLLYMFAAGVGNEWHVVGSDHYFAALPCAGTVPTRGSSMGSVKSLFR